MLGRHKQFWPNHVKFMSLLDSLFSLILLACLAVFTDCVWAQFRNIQLMLRKNSSHTLHTFWAGDPNNLTSTSAYVVFLGANPISWSSKKQKATPLALPQNHRWSQLDNESTSRAASAHLHYSSHLLRQRECDLRLCQLRLSLSYETHCYWLLFCLRSNCYRSSTYLSC